MKKTLITIIILLSTSLSAIAGNIFNYQIPQPNLITDDWDGDGIPNSEDLDDDNDGIDDIYDSTHFGGRSAASSTNSAIDISGSSMSVGGINLQNTQISCSYETGLTGTFFSEPINFFIDSTTVCDMTSVNDIIKNNIQEGIAFKSFGSTGSNGFGTLKIEFTNTLVNNIELKARASAGRYESWTGEFFEYKLKDESPVKQNRFGGTSGSEKLFIANIDNKELEYIKINIARKEGNSSYYFYVKVD